MRTLLTWSDQGTAGPPQVEQTLQYTTEIINGVTVYRVVS